MSAVPSRPEVVFVTRKWAPAMGGMETYCHRLTEALSTSYDLDIIALPGEADGSPPNIGRLTLFPFKVLQRWFDRDCVPDVLHIADMALWPVGLIAPQRTRIVLSAHGTDVSYPRRRGIMGRLYGAYLKVGSRLLKRAHAIANSASTEEALHENGWLNTSIVALATDIAEPEISLGKPLSSNRRILFAGRLIKRKGLLWFTQNVLDQLDEDIALSVAGTVWDEAERAALDHPKVDFLGRLDRHELAAAYARALCVILPNITMPNGEFEGFGLIACEASAAGGLVLAANIEGLTEAVIDGETGFHLPAGNSAAWVSKIREVAQWSEQTRTAFIAASINTSRAHYNWDRVARETSAKYHLS